VEFARTVEVLQRTLPPPDAVIADTGGGPGRYTAWLVEAGYEILHRDVIARVARRDRGVVFALSDLHERMDDPRERALLLDVLRAVEPVPDLVGLGPHLLATGRKE
jgi:hypothetical protein